MKHLKNFHYQITGQEQGPKLVFLHGLMGSGANFRSVAKAFETEYHILTFDQRGHGGSFHPENGYHPRDFASDLRLILDELGWEQVFLVGHSMGGRNALEFSIQFAQRVKALVIEDIGPEANSAAITRIENMVESVPVPFASRAEARRFFTEDFHYDKAVGDFLLTNIEERGPGEFNWRFAQQGIFAALRAGRNEDRWDALHNLTMPVLIIRGEHSEDLSRPVYERMLKALPHARGIEIKGAGHWVHFDQPATFIQVLKDFFDLSR